MVCKKYFCYAFAASIAVCLLSCKKDNGTPANTSPDIPADLSSVKNLLVDKSVSNETAALFYNMKKLAMTNTMFGHEDDTKRGVSDDGTSNWAVEQGSNIPAGQSDVKTVTGAYPAVYGQDFIHIANFADGAWYDYETKAAHDLAIDAYNRGGINTFCWHYANPVSKGGFYWSDSPVEAVSRIIPGGDYNGVFKNSLKEIAAFAKTLIGADGKLIPVIFRPFHEMDGDWFWWGSTHCTADNYKKLYQFTVTYLRDSLGVHNFLYAWSPDRQFTTLDKYMERYPGDDYVDVIGTDNYEDVKSGVALSVAAFKFKIVSDYAKSHKKIAALAETGLSNITKPDWYTNTLLRLLKTQGLQFAYALAWANTKDAYWTPYKNFVNADDFGYFKKDNFMIFGDRLPNMYSIK